MQHCMLPDCQDDKLIMKKISAIILILVCFFLISCKKGNINNQSVIATWELYKVSGQTTINYPSGNGTKWKLTESTYEFYVNNILEKTGTYSLVNDPTVSQSVCLVFPANQFKHRIIFDNRSDSIKVFIDVAGDTMSMVSGCFANDGGSLQRYTRK